VDFSSYKLPVTCGTTSGWLYKKKLAQAAWRGTKKCILGKDKVTWFSPTQFEAFGGRSSYKNWKLSILCGGYRLKKLIEKTNSLLCHSTVLYGDSRQENDDECMVCKDVGNLTCCDDCPRAFHRLCHIPLLTETEDSSHLSENWSCTFCRMKAQNELSKGPRFKEESEILIQEFTDTYMLSCEYLLLKLYCQKKSKKFAKNPCDTVPNYAEIIKTPMWLDQIRDNMARKKYHTVGKFIKDVHLVFKNCQTFNQANEFGEMGAQLSEDFERNFKEVF
uniref:SP110 nuclear body protein n=1 Tax=Latimeria chalumnae TaxID=7897 RepID=H3AH54_LATCH